MRLRWHVFGHDGSSYRTLAKSTGVSDRVSQRLERFTWGQTNKAAYRDSLAARPAFWVEHIEDLTAITRVLTGETDDEGRFVFRGVGVGRYSVVASRQDGKGQSAAVDVSLPQSRTITVILGPRD